MAKRSHVTYRDSKRYFDWLDRAGEDILAAGLLVQHDGCYQSAAFHCQQCIEKSLKAYILLKSNILPDGHNLSWLCKRASKYDATFSEWQDSSASLNKCYIETRYPADIALELDYGQVMGYYRMASDMYLFICEEIDRSLESRAAHPEQRAEKNR